MWTETFMPFWPRPAIRVTRCRCAAMAAATGASTSTGTRSPTTSMTSPPWSTGSATEPVLIGHSMGGFVVQKYLEHHTVPGAALLCSVPPQGLIAAQFHLMFQKPHLFMELNRIMEGRYTDSRTLREALFAGEVDERCWQAWLTRMQSESHRALWDMSMFNLPNLHAMNRPPMLILGAEHDVLVRPSWSRRPATATDCRCPYLPQHGPRGDA
jgi:pimeloyl-ACP methyl ester carboxylesterase